MLQSGSTAAKHSRFHRNRSARSQLGITWSRDESGVRSDRASRFCGKSDRAFFTRTLSNRNVPQVCIDLTSLTDAFNANLPLALPAVSGAAQDFPEERVYSVLDAAAQFRLRQKRIGFATRSTCTDAMKRFSRRSQPHSVTRKTSCRSHFSHSVCRCGRCAKTLRIARRCSLAQRVSWRRPTSTSTKNRRVNMCANCGIAGGRIAMICNDLSCRPKPGTLRTRPLNHPQRRLSALAVLVREWPRLQRASGKSSVAVANDFFQALEHPFWNFHYTLTSKASSKEMALIGESRAADILANVLFPFWAATSSRLPPRRAHSFGQNTRSCRRSYRTGDSKPLRRVFLEMIPAGKNFCARSRTNKGCSRFTKTFACRTIPIAHNARSRSK